MKPVIVTALALVATIVTADLAAAHSARRDARQRIQRVRIHQGWQHGQLTRFERARLVAGQQVIRRAERRAWRDGHISRAERRQIVRLQNHESRVIHRLRHNRRSR